MKIKRDDMVEVIAGKDRGKRGKVLRVFPREGRLIVEKINMIKRHTRPTQYQTQGGILEKEAKIHISNVMLVCSRCDAPVRVGRRTLEDGTKVRYCKKCNEVIDKT
ncbi:MAG: 50S ribosomal protein L24 [Nitrospinota bacterium]|nr:MAG: 50S ribosomal protein L24 [Nitrospinota bacterium]